MHQQQKQHKKATPDSCVWETPHSQLTTSKKLVPFLGEVFLLPRPNILEFSKNGTEFWTFCFENPSKSRLTTPQSSFCSRIFHWFFWCVVLVFFLFHCVARERKNHWEPNLSLFIILNFKKLLHKAKVWEFIDDLCLSSVRKYHVAVYLAACCWIFPCKRLCKWPLLRFLSTN